MRFDRLVILHGWGSDLSRWRPLVSALKPDFPVFLPQLPQDKVRNTAAYSDWLYEKTKQLLPFVLLGHSFGGQVAINFTARYPKRVAKLVLIGSAGVRRTSLKAKLLLSVAKVFNFMPDKLKQFAYRAIGETDYVNASPVMKKTMHLILKEDQQENMRKIDAPTLILWGKQDHYIRLRDGRLTQQLIKNSVLAEFNAKHSLPFSHAAEVAQKILWFIGSN